MRMVARFLYPSELLPNPVLRFEMSTQFPAQLVALSAQIFQQFECNHDNLSFPLAFDCANEPDCDGIFRENIGMNPIYQSPPGTSFVEPPPPT